MSQARETMWLGLGGKQQKIKNEKRKGRENDSVI